MLRIKRNYFTILEVLLVIAILGLVAGLLGINIRSAYLQQQFRTETALVIDQLRLAQDLMLLLQSDAHVKFQELPSQKGITLWIETEKPLAGGWSKELARRHLTLKAIRLVKFDDKSSTLKQSGSLDIRFLSGGSVMSRGTMLLSSSDKENDSGAMNSYVCLSGYPHPIESTQSEEEAKKCELEWDSSSFEPLTRIMKGEIQEREQKNAA